MKKMKMQKVLAGCLFFNLSFLTACSPFTGLRTPLYDGQKIQPDEEAITTYEESGEVIGAEKDYYIRYPFSDDVLEASLDYPDEAPLLLKEGTYLVGEDLPAGRATILGNESVFVSENYDVHVGNLIVRDTKGEVYFENLFHSEYGQLTVQLDLIEGHELTIIGKEPELTFFYAEKLPEDPYLLMEAPQLLQNLDQVEVQQPIEMTEEGNAISLTAGIYEVGVHIPEGVYLLSDLVAPHNTEMYLFREGTVPRVFELLIDKPEDKEIELMTGDKIYLNLVQTLKLTCSIE